MAATIAKITSDTSDSTTLSTSCNIDKLTVLYNSTEPGKGIPVEQELILSIQVTEHLSNKLPTMQLKIQDGGLWYNTYLFEIGKNIRVTITPKKLHEDQVVQPFINADYVIQSIEYQTDQEKVSYIYILNCICGTEKYINSICNWPVDKSTIPTTEYAKNSKEVMQEIVSEAGLKFICRFYGNPSDKMLWCCPNLTYNAFVNKIVDHAWFGKYNIPIVYIDRNKHFIYDTLNNICAREATNKFMLDSLYQQKALAAEEQKTKFEKYLTYKDLIFYNIGGMVANRNGYNVEASQYNPWENDEIETEINKKQELNDNEDGRFRKAKFNNSLMRVGKVSNKSASSKDTINNSKYTGSYFKDLHEFYNVAPLHHENLRNSFFTNYALLTFDTSKQINNGNQDSVYYPALADKIYIDASDKKFNNTIKSGDYIICGMTHVWVPHHAYTIAIQAVNDGNNAEGLLSQTSKLESLRTDTVTRTTTTYSNSSTTTTKSAKR